MKDQGDPFGQAQQDRRYRPQQQEPQQLEEQHEETQRLMGALERQRRREDELRERVRQAGEKAR